MSEFTKTLIVDCNNPDLVTNGDFGSSDEWILGSNWGISGGRASRTSNPTPSALEQDITLAEDIYYSIKYNVYSSSANSGILTLEGSFDNEELDSTSGEHLVVFKCVNSNNRLSLNLAAGATISLEYVSMTENFLTIQSAIEELGANGGCIIVEQGEDPYTITETLTPASNTNITSNGTAKIIMTANAPAFQFTDKERIIISGFEIEMDYDQMLTNSAIVVAGGTDCRFEDIKFLSSSSTAGSHYGIYFYKSQNNQSSLNVVRNCRFAGFEAGVRLNESKNNIIEGCVFENNLTNSKYGVYIENSSEYPSGQNVVINCIMNEMQGTGTDDSGIFVYESDYNIALGNIAYNGGSSGINAKRSIGTVIGGNICDSNTGDGIRLVGESGYPTKYSSIVGNVSSSNGINNITVKNYSENNSIAGNVCPEGSNKEIVTQNLSANSLIDGNVCASSEAAGEIESNSADDIITCNLSSLAEGNPGYTFQEYTTGSGNFTVPAGVNLINFILVGSGGAGGHANGAKGSGGGGGGEIVMIKDYKVTPAATIAYSIGAAPTSGQNGNNTTFGRFTAYGGLAGVNTGTGGNGGKTAITGGAGSVYDTAGVDGTDSHTFWVGRTGGGGGGGAASASVAGAGGNTIFATGGAGGGVANGGGGGGASFGAGGAGGANGQSGVAAAANTGGGGGGAGNGNAGGNGGSGYIVIWY